MLRFGTGAVLATLVFLGLVALLAGWAHFLMPEVLIRIFNGMVGIVLVGFGIRMVLRKGPPAGTALRVTK